MICGSPMDAGCDSIQEGPVKSWTFALRVGRPYAFFFVCAAAVIGTHVLTARAQSAPPYASVSSDIVRLSEQATFGPTPALITHIQDIGIGAFIDEQLAVPLTPYPTLPPMPSTAPVDCTGTCRRDNYTMYPLQQHFFQNALQGEDQLRQRVAFALGQIFVTSGIDIRLSSWMGPYQQILYNDAFGTFGEFLDEVTLSPSLGSYLNLVIEQKDYRTTGER